MQVGTRPIAGPSWLAEEGQPGASVLRPPPAPQTVRLYRADWTAFAAWCDAAGLTALPADPATVAGFLGAAAARLSAGALGRRAAAIGDQHRRRGLASPAAESGGSRAEPALSRDGRRPG